MSEHDVEQRKKEAAALTRRKEQSEKTANLTEEEKALIVAKMKAEAAAKAKAAAFAKRQNQSRQEQETSLSTQSETKSSEPLPNQDKLNLYVKMIEEQIGEGNIEEAFINSLSKHVPTLVVKPDDYYETAKCLKEHKQLQFDYVSELHGTDFQTHLEVYVHLYSYSQRQSVVLKVKLERDRPVLPSLVPLWVGADWPECEAYDLLGIQFDHHPDLKRILLGEEWVGFPLRKDYEPYDEGV